MVLVRLQRYLSRDFLLTPANAAPSPFLIKAFLVSIAYLAAAKVGLSLAETTQQVTAVWPPTGIALVVLVLGGYRYWPAIFIGAFLANLFTHEPALVAFIIAAGNTLAGLSAAYLLKRFTKFNGVLDNIPSVLGLVFLAAIASTLISATIGTTALRFGSLIGASEYPQTWLTWWFGDMMGIIIFAPFIFVILSGRLVASLLLRPIEWIALLSSSATLSFFIFTTSRSSDLAAVALPYVVFPLLVWASVRFNEIGAVMTVFVISILAISGTLRGLGPFSAGGSLEQNLLYLYIFIGMMAVTALILGAIVAERRRFEQQLVVRTQDLVDSKARLLQAMTKNKESERQRDQLVSMASHELKTPLTSAQLFSTILLRDLKKGHGSERAHEYASKISQSLERLSRLTADFIDVSRTRTGLLKIQKEPTDVDQLIEEVAHDMRLITQKHEIEIIGRVGKLIELDAIRIRQILVNLFRNASKHSPPGGKIIMSVAADGRYLTVSVQDFGVGIPKKEHQKIFEPFYQVNSPSGSPPGLGLGLFIVKQIVELHKGRVWIQASSARGSTFVFRIPITTGRKKQ